MVILRLLAIGFSSLCLAAPMPVAGVGDTALLRAAAMALEQGDVVQAKAMAKSLSERNAALGAVYRVDWIATQIERRRAAGAAAVSPQQLSWKASSEIWQDEWQDYSARPVRARGIENLKASAEEIQALKSVLLDDKNYSSGARSELELPLATLLYWERADSGSFTQERSLPKDVQLATEQWESSGRERCQWKARKVLLAPSRDSLENWHQHCAPCDGLFCGVAKVQLADTWAESARYEEALQVYQQAARNLNEPSIALNFRIVALQILAAKPLENLLRSVASLENLLVSPRDSSGGDLGSGNLGSGNLGSGNLGSGASGITDAQLWAVRSQVCSDFSDLSPARLKALFQRVYAKKTWTREVRQWMLRCEGGESDRLAKIRDLPGLSQYERESIELAAQVRHSRKAVVALRAQRERSRQEATETRLRSDSRRLPGTLQVPVLMPFPTPKYSLPGFRLSGLFKAAMGNF